MASLNARKTTCCLAIYLGIAFLIHAPVLAGNHFIPPGREELVIQMALSSLTLTGQLLTYLVTVLFLNIVPILFLLAGFSALSGQLKNAGISSLPYFALTSLCFWLAALAVNGIYFPRSAFSILLPFGDNTQTKLVGTAAIIIFLLLVVIPALWLAAKYVASWTKRPAIRLAVCVAMLIGVIPPLYSWVPEQAATHARPNVIIIGIDSLSPMHLASNPGALGFLENILSDSMLFTNNITPLARTFPAWTSILTSKYPVNNGARFNLTNFEAVDKSVTLAHILKTEGYKTIYAQDERKFNNIDEEFGFDASVGPTPGAAEFILTKISDHPVANLALLLPISRQFFPFIYLNRADHIHYEPKEFVEATLRGLQDAKDKPVFLAAHFCLAHHPYTWRTQSKVNSENGEVQSLEQQHISALASLEEQISALLRGLKKSGRLENAILIVLSDHGESMAYTNGLWPRVTQQTGRAPFNTRSSVAGHGENILDRSQYQSVLAFKGYGSLAPSFPVVQENGITSLVDVMPTILTALKIPVPPGIDGVNLLGGTASPAYYSRTVVAETGISFGSLTATANLNEDEILEEAKKFYSVEPESARLYVSEDYFEDLVSVKDMAIHSNDWLLALLRNNSNQGDTRVAVLVHKPTGRWTAGTDHELIEEAPLDLLVSQAEELYGNEIADFEQSWVFH